MSYYPNCYNEDLCCRPPPIQECCNFPQQPNVIVVGIIGYGSFYFTTPAAQVLVGNPFSFPLQTVVPSGGIARQSGTSTTTFTLAVAGIYEFSWQMTALEGDVQIAIRLNNVEVAASRIGTAVVGTQQTNTILLPVTANSTVQLIVATGSNSPVTPVIFGSETSTTTGNFVIKRISTNTF